MAKSKYNKELRERAAELAEKGCTDKEIFESLNIGKDTFYRYLKKYKDFSDALKKARETPIEDVEAALYKKAIGYDVMETTEQKNEKGEIEKVVSKTKHIPGDVAAMIFYLTNKAPDKWVNSSRTHLKAENDNEDKKPIEIIFKRSDEE